MSVNPKIKKEKCLLVDYYSTTEKEKFLGLINLIQGHAIELANGSRAIGVAQGKIDACVKLHGNKGRLHKITLIDALYVPSYKRDIMSVRATT